MNSYAMLQVDNRDAGQMYEYLEARIDVLKRRVFELEKENQILRIEARGSQGLMDEDRDLGLLG